MSDAHLHKLIFVMCGCADTHAHNAHLHNTHAHNAHKKKYIDVRMHNAHLHMAKIECAYRR
jgi:hypothetical protein